MNYRGGRYILIENRMLGRLRSDRFLLFPFKMGQYRSIWHGYNVSNGVVHLFLNFDYNSMSGDFTTVVLEVGEKSAKVVSKPGILDFNFKVMKYVTLREVMFGAGLPR